MYAGRPCARPLAVVAATVVFDMNMRPIWAMRVPFRVALSATVVLFPITFVSNVFVPPQSLPSFLQPIAEWNPTSTLTGALRQLWGNPNPYASTSFPAENPVLVTLAWVVVIIAIFGPLGVRRYRSMSR